MRLDLCMVARGLCETRSKARDLMKAGAVTVPASLSESLPAKSKEARKSGSPPTDRRMSTAENGEMPDRENIHK